MSVWATCSPLVPLLSAGSTMMRWSVGCWPKKAKGVNTPYRHRQSCCRDGQHLHILGIHISWSLHTTAVVKVEHQHIYSLSCLRRFAVCTRISTGVLWKVFWHDVSQLGTATALLLTIEPAESGEQSPVHHTLGTSFHPVHLHCIKKAGSMVNETWLPWPFPFLSSTSTFLEKMQELESPDIQT